MAPTKEKKWEKACSGVQKIRGPFLELPLIRMASGLSHFGFMSGLEYSQRNYLEACAWTDQKNNPVQQTVVLLDGHFMWIYPRY